MTATTVCVETAKHRYDALCACRDVLLVGSDDEFWPGADVRRLFIGEPHIPKVLAAFHMLDLACQFINGPAVDVTIVAGPDIEEPVRLPPRAWFFFGSGRWLLTWTQL